MKKTKTRNITINAETLTLQTIASKDITRGLLKGVHFDKGVKFAADGHAMVVAEKGLDEPESGIYQFSVKKAKRHTCAVHFSGEGHTLVSQDGKHGKTTVHEGMSPNYKQIIPSTGREEIIIGIDADLLLKLAKVLSVKTRVGGHRVYIAIDKNDVLAPFTVAGDKPDMAGIIMPLRNGDHSDKASYISPTKRLNDIANRKGK